MNIITKFFDNFLNHEIVSENFDDSTSTIHNNSIRFEDFISFLESQLLRLTGLSTIRLYLLWIVFELSQINTILNSLEFIIIDLKDLR